MKTDKFTPLKMEEWARNSSMEGPEDATDRSFGGAARPSVNEKCSGW